MDAVEEIDVFQVVYQLKSLIPHFMENIVSWSNKFNFNPFKIMQRILMAIKWQSGN